MGIFAMLVLALGMSMDAFAAALARGATLSKNSSFATLLRTGLVFGGIELMAPMLGYAFGSLAANLIHEWDHWVAFVLLVGLGIRMIYEGFVGNDEETDGQISKNTKKGIWLLIMTAIGTSIDSVIVGVSLAFINVNIWLAALLIGLATTSMATVGLWLGRFLGSKIGKWAEVGGGLVLICIGVIVLIEDLHLLS